MLLSVIICVVGLVMYLIATNPKVSTVGLHMFWVGLFVALMQCEPYVSRIALR